MDIFNYGLLLLTQRFPNQRDLGGGSNDVMFFFIIDLSIQLTGFLIYGTYGFIF